MNGVMMLRTRLCETLDIEVPIFGAPMGPEIACLELAAAVSNAGGLGIISFGGYPPPALRERIRKLRTLTSRPFGVNVLLEGPHLPLPDAAFVDVCVDERVPVLSLFWGDPGPYVERPQGGHQSLRPGGIGQHRKTRTGGWCRLHHRSRS
jgi:nitronate monooxygenase